MKRQLRIFAEPTAVQAVDVTSYDVLAVSSSAGKDSQAMLDRIVELATAAGVKDRIVVIHADLGRVEWQGTRELAEEQAHAYGVRFMVVSRQGTVSDGRSKEGVPLYAKGEVRGDLIDHVRHRAAQLRAQGKDSPAWPSPQNRWCTSDHKRGPIGGAFTTLACCWRAAHPDERRPCRILDCIGLRSEESPARAKHANLEERTSTRSQHVDTWLPIQDWTVGQVWDRIRKSGVRHHYAYDLGMPRLSCCLCIYAPREALLLAGYHNQALLRDYVAVEQETDSTFGFDFALGDILREVEGMTEPPAKVSNWGAGA